MSPYPDPNNWEDERFVANSHWFGAILAASYLIQARASESEEAVGGVFWESDADGPYERVFSWNEFERRPAEHAERFGKVPLEGIGEGVNERACDEASDFVGKQERENMSHDCYREFLHLYLSVIHDFHGEVLRIQ